MSPFTGVDAGVSCPHGLSQQESCERCDEIWGPWEEGQEPAFPDIRPTEEGVCGFEGHPYSGDDHPDTPDGGRCYCGRRRYPTGGGVPNVPSGEGEAP